MNAPFQTAALARTAMAQWQRLRTPRWRRQSNRIVPGDRRFAHPAWQQRPTTCSSGGAARRGMVDSIVRSPGGVDPHNQRIVAFTVRNGSI